MVNVWTIVFTRQAQKDAVKISKSGLKANVETLLDILRTDPYQPPCEKLVGQLSGALSRRINIKHRLVYQVFDSEKTVKILRMWTHYDQ